MNSTEFFENDDVDSNQSSPMKDYYKDKSIFLTGVTGFLGQLYIEKLLRSEVKVIYVLIRPKKEVSPTDRLQLLFSGKIFNKIQRQDPNYMKKICMIEGDLREQNLGIVESDLEKLYANVEIILHAAAEVRFDGKLSNTILINMKGTRELLKIATRTVNLQVFCYISTAYSSCYRLHCDEEFYEPSVDPDVLINLCEKYSEKLNDEIQLLSDRIMKPWPNSYTFSKSLTEELIRRFGLTRPACVIRPSIVISTFEDPMPAWCNNNYGLNGVLVACGLGLLRLMPLNRKIKGDIVCADFVTNSTLATIWYTYKENYLNKNNIGTQIVHVNTTEDKPATWGEITDEMNKRCTEEPNIHMIWIQCPNSTICPFMWKYLTIFYHVIPGILMDLLLAYKKDKKRILPIQRKVQHFMEALKFFMTNEWRFTNTNMKRIWNEMSLADRQFYPSDVRKYDWKNFTYDYCHGLTIYIIKDYFEDVSAAKKRFRKYQILHYIVLMLYYGFHFSILYLILKYVYMFNNINNSVIGVFEFIKSLI